VFKKVTADSKARLFAVPDYALDKHTERGKGTDTSSRLSKAAAVWKVEVSNWSQEEKLKSHGPGIKTVSKSARNKKQAVPMQDEKDTKQTSSEATQVSQFFDVGAIVSSSWMEDPYAERCRAWYMYQEDK
jgi:hypothetical protein